MAVGYELLSLKHMNTSLRHAAEKADFVACPNDIKGGFWGCKDLAGSGASERSGSPWYAQIMEKTISLKK